MRPFMVVVTDELRNGLPKVPVSQWDQPVEAFFLDGADEALGMGIRVRSAVRRLDDAHATRRELVPDRVKNASGWRVEPKICTCRDARSMRNRV